MYTVNIQYVYLKSSRTRCDEVCDRENKLSSPHKLFTLPLKPVLMNAS